LHGIPLCGCCGGGTALAFASEKEVKMRVFESAAVGLVALIAQVLVVATVLI
jgi:hypothetical protein